MLLDAPPPPPPAIGQTTTPAQGPSGLQRQRRGGQVRQETRERNQNPHVQPPIMALFNADDNPEVQVGDIPALTSAAPTPTLPPPAVAGPSNPTPDRTARSYRAAAAAADATARLER